MISCRVGWLVSELEPVQIGSVGFKTSGKEPTSPGGLDEVPNMVMGRTVGQSIRILVISIDDLT